MADPEAALVTSTFPIEEGQVALTPSIQLNGQAFNLVPNPELLGKAVRTFNDGTTQWPVGEINGVTVRTGESTHQAYATAEANAAYERPTYNLETGHIEIVLPQRESDSPLGTADLVKLAEKTINDGFWRGMDEVYHLRRMLGLQHRGRLGSAAVAAFGGEALGQSGKLEALMAFASKGAVGAVLGAAVGGVVGYGTMTAYQRGFSAPEDLLERASEKATPADTFAGRVVRKASNFLSPYRTPRHFRDPVITLQPAPPSGPRPGDS